MSVSNLIPIGRGMGIRSISATFRPTEVRHLSAGFEDQPTHHSTRFRRQGVPVLSPDDNYIVAVSDTNLLTLFDMKNQKWTELTKITAQLPKWSHDGRYVYFDSTAGG